MKTYTKQEIRAAFEKINSNYRLQECEGGRRRFYENDAVQMEFDGWLACARFLGVLSEAHKGETDK